jgi:hypothetical protein
LTQKIIKQGSKRAIQWQIMVVYCSMKCRAAGIESLTLLIEFKKRKKSIRREILSKKA